MKAKQPGSEGSLTGKIPGLNSIAKQLPGYNEYQRAKAAEFEAAKKARAEKKKKEVNNNVKS